MDGLLNDGAGGYSIIGIIVLVAVFLFSKMRGGKGGGISIPGGGGGRRPTAPTNPTAPRQQPGTAKKPSGGSGAGNLVRDIKESGESKKEF